MPFRPHRNVALAALLSIAVSATVNAPASASHRTVASLPGAAPTAQLAEPKLFVHGSSTLFNPDGVVVTQHYVFVVWQGQSDHLPGPSTIVKYDLNGKTLGSVALTGRCDGLRLNPTTKKLWAVLNNDGANGNPARQPLLFTIDPLTLATKQYAFAAVQPHGGGYDDIAFTGGQAYLSASSPTLTAGGVNDKPAIVSATLTADGHVSIAPILYGNTMGFDEKTGTTMRLNISDPDSLVLDPKGDLALVGDNDQEVIVVVAPGTSNQTVLRYGFGTQFDDVAWTTGTSGTLWAADTRQNAVYTVAAQFGPRTVFAEGPAGIPVQSFIGTVGAGEIITPLLTQRDGVFSPTALVFVPAGGATDGI